MGARRLAVAAVAAVVAAAIAAPSAAGAGAVTPGGWGHGPLSWLAASSSPSLWVSPFTPSAPRGTAGVRAGAPGLRNDFSDGTLAGFEPSLEGASAPTVIGDPTGSAATSNVASVLVPAGRTRAELITRAAPGVPPARAQFVPGDEIFFGSGYFLPLTFPHDGAAPRFQVVRQWKTDRPDQATSAPVALSAGGFDGGWLVDAAGFPGAGSRESHRLGPIARGVWTRFVVRIRFATDPSASRVQVWRSDGGAPYALAFDSDDKRPEVIGTVQVETRTGWWPSFTGEPAGSEGGTFRVGSLAGYEKHGLYRDPAWDRSAALLTTGTRWGRTFAEVAEG